VTSIGNEGGGGEGRKGGGKKGRKRRASLFYPRPYQRGGGKGGEGGLQFPIGIKKGRRHEAIPTE